MKKTKRGRSTITAPSLLNLGDDVLGSVLCAARSIGALEPLASTCRKLNELARSRIPVSQLRLQDAASACLLFRLIASGRPLFRMCDSMVAVAEDEATHCKLPRVLRAAAGFSSLRTLDLTISLTKAAAEPTSAQLEDYDGSVAGLISDLRALKQLQQLKLAAPVLGRYSAAELSGMKQLTSLQLSKATDMSGQSGRKEVHVNLVPPDLSFLAGMSGLVELEVGCSADMPQAAAAARPFTLPSSLQRLRLVSEAVSATDWLQHLPECPQLTELEIHTNIPAAAETYTHPAAMLDLAATHTPGLLKLTCSDSYRCHPDQRWVDRVDPNYEQPLPNQALHALTALQHLDGGGCLCVRDAAGWKALGAATALTSLVNVVMYQPPPQPWQHTRLQQLAVALENVSGDGAVQLLRACPALQQAHLSMAGRTTAPDAAGAAGGSTGQQGVPLGLSSLRLEYQRRFYKGSLSPAAHAAPVLAAASGVAELCFHGMCWEEEQQQEEEEEEEVRVVLPDLSGCTALTRLCASADCDDDAGAAAEDVVGMVQPLAPTLRVLTLQYFEEVSPRAATSLQVVLPRLEHVTFRCCREMCHQDPYERRRRKYLVGSEEVKLAELQQQLHPGLTLSVSRA